MGLFVLARDCLGAGFTTPLYMISMSLFPHVKPEITKPASYSYKDDTAKGKCLVQNRPSINALSSAVGTTTDNYLLSFFST